MKKKRNFYREEALLPVKENFSNYFVSGTECCCCNCDECLLVGLVPD